MGRALWIVLVLVACGGDDKQRRELVNDGRVCLRLRSDGTVEAQVTFRGCLTSCDVAQPTSCRLSTDGGSLLVESQGAVETTGASVCSADCGELTASCTSTETVAPGSYTVHHGAGSEPLTLGSQTTCLFN